MCGIAGGVAPCPVDAALDRIAHRGPDARGVAACGEWVLGHVRLAIVDLDHRSDQPMQRGATTVAYNGELWNWHELRADLEAAGVTFTTAGDTEVVAWALDTWGPAALARFDGMFAVAWVTGDGPCRLARDTFGEVPLHYGMTPSGPVFASELAGMLAAGAYPSTVRWVEPAAVTTLTADSVEVTPYRTLDVSPLDLTVDQAAAGVRSLLDAAVERRAAVADVPQACLVSGGIDSSSVAFLLRDRVPNMALYTAVHDPDSLDLRCAREVAEMLDLPLVEVEVKAPTADDLSRVVRVIEEPHKAQVEIGWACLALADALAADGVKVVYSGEGSDELWGAYGSSYHGWTRHPEGWFGYRRDAVIGQHRKNFARCNKVFMARSVESRLPFIDLDLVEWGLHLPYDAVWSTRPTADTKSLREKGHMRRAFLDDLPRSVIHRDKLAFQTGAGLRESAAAAVADPQRYYRAEFARQFPGVKP